MDSIKQIWNIFKAEADVWFFYGFLVAFPFSIRKVLIFYPIQGQFNEWSGIYLYLSDILLILALISWLIILCNKYRLLSILRISPLNKDNLWKRLYPQFTPTPKSLQLKPKPVKFLVWGLTQNYFLACLGLILVLWSFGSIFWSESKSLSLFHSIKLLELYLLAIYVALRIVSRLPVRRMFHACPSGECSTWNIRRRVEHLDEGGTFLGEIFKLLIFGGVINSILAFYQFIFQHSAGFKFLKESFLAPNMPGVAKVILGDHVFIRSYGFFPHPNVLGGFLLVSIILTIFYRPLINKECSTPARPKNVPRGTFEGGWNIQNNTNRAEGGKILQQAWNILSFKTQKDAFLSLILIIQIFGIFLTFSKSALIGLFLAITWIYVSQRYTSQTTNDQEIVPRLPRKMFHVEHLHWGGTFGHMKEIFDTLKNLIEKSWNSQTDVKHSNENHKAKNKLWTKMFHVEHLSYLVLITFFGFFALISFFPNLSPIQNQSLRQRQMIMDVSRLPLPNLFHVEQIEVGGKILANTILGSGQGQSIWLMRKLDLPNWQIQPVHNVFLLIWSELGIIGLILFLYILWRMFHPSTNVPPQYKCSTWNILRGRRGTIYGAGVEHSKESGLLFLFKAILLGFTFIMLFDHYLWDIQQGQILLWMVFGFIQGFHLTNKNDSDMISLS